MIAREIETIDASPRLLLLHSATTLTFHFSFKIYSKWTVAVILIADMHHEGAVCRICFKTFQKSLEPNVFCLA
jgi:hypothetical protein